MIEVRQTERFRTWLGGLKDSRARQKIAARIDRLAFGNPGDIKPVGGGVSELRVHYGPGYRIYLVQRGEAWIMLLCGGSKRSQRTDITKAKALAKQIED